MLAVKLTGGGKSLFYMLPALCSAEEQPWLMILLIDICNIKRIYPVPAGLSALGI